MNEVKASCHCGKVKWSFSLPATAIVQCHCQNCRRLQGSDYSTWIAVTNDQFSVDLGKETLSHYKFNDQSSKSFCSSCGTVVYGVNGKHFRGHKMISLGAVEEYSASLEPQIQVYTQNKAEWVQLHDGVPISTAV